MMHRPPESDTLSGMPFVLRLLSWRTCVRYGWMLGWWLVVPFFGEPTRADPLSLEAAPETVTQVSQIRSLAEQSPTNSYSIALTGVVWWANPREGKFVLRDNSGAEELEMDFPEGFVTTGQRVRIVGNGTIASAGNGFKIGARGPVVDDDGVHTMVEKAGAVYLKSGLNPLCVEWFNGADKYGLTVEYQGPGLDRQKIPATALFRTGSGQPGFTTPAESGSFVHGLDFICTEAPAETLPDFELTNALKTGVVSNFDLGIVPHPEHVGVLFRGYLQIPRDGFYTFYLTSDDGSRLYVGEPSLQFKVIGSSDLPPPRPLLLGQALPPTGNGTPGGLWGEVEGKVTFASEDRDGLILELSTETGGARVEVAHNARFTTSSLLNHRVRAIGYCQGTYASDGRKVLGAVLVPDDQNIKLTDTPPALTQNPVTNADNLPLLVNAVDVHRLKREEAQRGYPVRIRGVITATLPEHQAFTIQDSTRGIYVQDYSESRSDPPHIGEFLEVRGISDPSLFAPVVNASNVQYLGIGNLPEPVHPTRDQLMNGSLDGQYVELQGILSSVQPDGVILLTTDGRIKCDLRVVGLQPSDLVHYEDALIRVRGCFLATWDYVTHQVKMDEIRIYGGSITVDQPAPTDLFSVPRKTASSLFLFDPQASMFQRVKVAGQIIHIRGAECFMMDGNDGVRFMAKHETHFTAGDLVEVVGFPEISAGSPILREAVVRLTGHADLPPPRVLQPDDLVRTDLDSTRVRVKAVLVDQRPAGSGQTLEMRMGLRSVLASLPATDDRIRAIPVGSLLELTGTFATQGVGQNAASSELLLNSPADIVVLARPPWWTLAKLFVILGALACVLAITVLWISQLRRKVEQRTAELEAQIQERQRVEQQHAMEQERARIAQDLHDELGSSLTEITMLGIRARATATPLETRGKHVEQMSDKARQMVTALDEIVWAMNPTHDSLASMVSYFSLYAERFLGLANIAWRLEGPIKPDDHAVDSRHRHQLFLAFKEALTNIVRHSGATEVRLTIEIERGHIRLTIIDNGRGWAGASAAGMDGVNNMRARLEKLGGRFEVTSKAGEGTTVRFELPYR
jgi:signal transduction histidine kinase